MLARHAGIEQGWPQLGIPAPSSRGRSVPLRPCSYGYSSLWKTVGSLLPGLLFIPNKFDRLRVAPMRPFWIPGARTPLQGPQHLPDDRQHQNNEHRVSGPPADAVHSRTRTQRRRLQDHFAQIRFLQHPDWRTPSSAPCHSGKAASFFGRPVM